MYLFVGCDWTVNFCFDNGNCLGFILSTEMVSVTTMAFQAAAVLLGLVIFYQFSSGQDQESVYVSVESSSRAFYEGTRQSLSCTVDPFDFVLVSVSWLKNDGHLITNSSRVMVRNFSLVFFTLKFNPLRISDGGQYQCVATVLRNGVTFTVNFTDEFTINVIISKYNRYDSNDIYPFLRLGF